MAYLDEFRAHWRALLAATLGLGSGLSIFGFVNSTLAPFLLKDLGWTKAEFAATTGFGLLIFFLIPVPGRLVDLYGVRRVAAVGIVGFPLSMLAQSSMTGPVYVFYAIYVLQVVFCVTTIAVVYTRLVAERFIASRGFALAVVASGPALAGALGAPLLHDLAVAEGWRAAYRAVALYSIVMGVLTLLIAPSGRDIVVGRPDPERVARRDYRAILGNPLIWLLLVASFLCTLPQAVAFSQLALMLEGHLPAADIRLVVSVFAIGTLAGRFLIGVALDRFATWAVTVVGMSASGFGVLILAAPDAGFPAVAAGVALLGITYGGETDLLAYATARYFGVKVYGSVLGLFASATGSAASVGALIVSATLAATGSYQPFLIGSGLVAIVASLMFVRLRTVPAAEVA